MLIADASRTIVATSTPPGAGAIAIIRLSGKKAFSIAASFLRPPAGRRLAAPKARMAYTLSIMDSGKLIDRTVVLFYNSPKSYTGEDTVEIFCHGSPYVIRSIINLAVKAGASPAEPGEFTQRAFLNGKLDLAQAEAVNDLIASQTESAHRAATNQIEGTLSRQVSGLKAGLIPLLACIEARLDDSFGDIPAFREREFAEKVKTLLCEIRRLSAGFESGRRVKEGISVVISGAANSGKSSLLNALLGYPRAIVSPQAGTTRDTLEAGLELEGFRVMLTDTAGLNPKAAGNIERQGITRAISAIKSADIILLLKDASIRETAADRQALEIALKNAGRGALLLRILNKTDLPAAARKKPGKGELAVSCKTGFGLRGVIRAIISRERRCFAGRTPAVITSVRHFNALSLAALELEKLIKLSGKRPLPLELAAEHLRGATRALAAILGETAPEEILADIFKNFCVGK